MGHSCLLVLLLLISHSEKPQTFSVYIHISARIPLALSNMNVFVTTEVNQQLLSLFFLAQAESVLLQEKFPI